MAANFGNNAVPGFMWPGYALTGYPVTGAPSPGGTQAMYIYSGAQTSIYPQYFDSSTRKPLVATPGGSYAIYAIIADLYPAVPPNDDANWR